MITSSPSEFLRAFAGLPELPPARPRAAFMVTPTGFAFAAESASDNAYMQAEAAIDPQRALAQHEALARALREDLPVIRFPGDPRTPEAVFPNNVFATRPGALIVGRMRHAVRRAEADREDIRQFFTGLLGYATIDLSTRRDLVAELTGVLVIDHARGVGYCGMGERCDAAGVRAMHEAFGLNLSFCFALAPGEYHTNVLLTCLAGRGVILAADGFADAAVPESIAAAYQGRALVLDTRQKASFAANAITLTPDRVWMSEAALASLSPAQRDDLDAWGFAVGSVALDEIEKAGGSLRCCVAEIF